MDIESGALRGRRLDAGEPTSADRPAQRSRLARRRLLPARTSGFARRLDSVLTTFALNATYLPGDPQIVRWVQSAPWGPLAITFPWVSWLSGTGQFVVAALLVLVVAAANWRAVPFALIGASGGAP